MIRKIYKSFGIIQKRLFWIAFIGLFVFGITQVDMSQVRGLLTALGLRVETVSTIQNLEDYNGYGSTVYVTDTSRGGTFKYVSTGLTPDSGTVFKANGKGGGYWRRQWDFLKVNATWFGASNNGVTDATNGIQLAINFLDINKGGTGGTVYFPAGTYIVSSPIFFGNKVNLEGTWWSTIQAANGSNCDMFQNPASGNIGYFKVVSLRFNGNNSNNPTGSFYHVRYNGSQSSDQYFENCLIVHFSNDAFNIENGWQYHINNCVIEFIGGSCVRLNPSISNAAQNDIRRVWISNCGLYKTVGDSISAAIEMSGSMINRYILGVYITNCNIQNSGAFQPAIRMKGAQDVQITGSFITAYPDNSLNNQVSVITVDSSALGSITGNNINSWLEYGIFSGSSSWNKAKYGIYYTDSSFNWTSSGNNFYNIGTDSVQIDPSCYNIKTPQSIVSGTSTTVSGNTISVNDLINTNRTTYENKIDLSAKSNFPGIDFIYPGGSSSGGTGVFRAASVSVLGTNDIFFQALPLTTAGYGYLEAFNSAGLVLGTGNASNNTTAPIIFRLNRIEVGRITSSGDFGFGVSSPTAIIHLKAGTATASTAPLKFTTGTNLTTPENGAVEFDGTNYYITSNSTRYILTKTLTGTAAPTTTPLSVGVHFIDTTNKKEYVSTGTSSSADWTILN